MFPKAQADRRVMVACSVRCACRRVRDGRLRAAPVDGLTATPDAEQSCCSSGSVSPAGPTTARASSRVADSNAWRSPAASGGEPLLLADEPTANLDYVQAEGIITLLRDIASSGHTVIVSTHDDRLLPIADASIDLSPSLTDEPDERTVTLEVGETLFRQRSSGSRVCLIESGRLTIVRELTDGSEEYLAERGAGEYVGELGPMLGQPRSATARAIEPTILTSLSLQEFRQRSRAAPAR